jgi:hypothetical protein
VRTLARIDVAVFALQLTEYKNIYFLFGRPLLA